MAKWREGGYFLKKYYQLFVLGHACMFLIRKTNSRCNRLKLSGIMPSTCWGTWQKALNQLADDLCTESRKLAKIQIEQSNK